MNNIEETYGKKKIFYCVMETGSPDDALYDDPPIMTYVMTPYDALYDDPLQ